ncbi:hypothetical protein NDU88_006814 [Pleurodeles waltl]|uniref:Uncharacterized protein n=1 Tax=Pleurodeles waltl TaxID=8319 RepID=A0AAV7N1Y7_PLEWA|nr:hypothetical protein NDU88_006814 [Pleurodeles waltl]
MVKPKTHSDQQSNKMDNYAIASQASTPSGQGSAEPSLGAIMAAISDLKSALEPKLDTIKADVSLLCAVLQKMVDKLSTAKSDIQTLRASSKSVEEQVRTLTAQHPTMAARLEDQEGRARRNNIRVVEVLEGAEGASEELFLEDLILKTLCPKRLSNFFSVEREHQTPGPTTRPRAPPRTIIARIFNHRNGDAILQAARTHGDLHCENATIKFFQDYILQVQKQRRSFNKVKKAMRQGTQIYDAISGKAPGASGGQILVFYLTSRGVGLDQRLVSERPANTGEKESRAHENSTAGWLSQITPNPWWSGENGEGRTTRLRY